jgi:hypothetical protein
VSACARPAASALAAIKTARREIGGILGFLFLLLLLFFAGVLSADQ